jgi:hypothetical protein
VQLPEERPQDWLTVEVRERRVPKRVKRSYIDGVRVPQHRERQSRHERLVQMNQVELLFLQQLLCLQVRAQR